MADASRGSTRQRRAVLLPPASSAAEAEAEQERLLPIANVGRIMKQGLPRSTKVSKEAKETMQECASEFVSFVTAEASERCRRERRKTLNGDDICWALQQLGFDDYVEPMRLYLAKYRENENARAAACGAGLFLPDDNPEPSMPLFGRPDLGPGSSSNPFTDWPRH